MPTLIYISVGSPICAKINDTIVRINDQKLLSSDLDEMVAVVCEKNGNNYLEILNNTGDVSFSFVVPDVARFKCFAYKQRKSIAAILKITKFGIPSIEDLKLEKSVIDNIANLNHGLILITGHVNNGKSTTIATIIDKVNEKYNRNIITIEEAFDYIHKHKSSYITQREIFTDVSSRQAALNGSLKYPFDLIYLDKITDYETALICLELVEAGSEVITTLNSVGIEDTIDTFLRFFPESMQGQIKERFARALKVIYSQKLIPIQGEKIPVFEYMMVDYSIRQELVNYKHNDKINEFVRSHKDQGMRFLDDELIKLYKDNKTSKETLFTKAINKARISKLNI